MKHVYLQSDALFSEDGTRRYWLYRQWDRTKTNVMFIGLNPSTAGKDRDDPTIRRVVAISKALGYGGVYMLNCFPFISTDPKKLEADRCEKNIEHLAVIGDKVEMVFFAWGNFDIVSYSGMFTVLCAMFPDAQALFKNKNGSPKHPLYCRTDIQPIKFIR